MSVMTGWRSETEGHIRPRIDAEGKGLTPYPPRLEFLRPRRSPTRCPGNRVRYTEDPSRNDLERQSAPPRGTEINTHMLARR